MNKKYIIISSITVVIILIIALLISIIPSKERVYKTITLDINPSIEINLNKEDKVISVNPLNEDAKVIVEDNLKGKSFDDALKSISNKLIENDYGKDGEIVMLINSSKKENYDELINKVRNSFNDSNVYVDIIPVEKVSKEDEKFAKEHNITPYKAAYLNSIKEENESVDIEQLIDKPIKEITEIKNTGNYCDPGYFLEGDHCFKEIERIPAKEGNVCPREYMEYSGKCYKEEPYLEKDNYKCSDGFVLKDNKCINTSSMDADGDCETNNYIKDEDMCLEEVIVGDAYEYCRDPGRTLYNGKCLATKPTINGGCLNGDMLYNGKCVNTRNDYYLSEWKCPNGETISRDNGELLYPDKKCRETRKVKPTSYKCPDGFILDGKTCTRTDIQDAQKERYCPSGYTKVEFDRCINFNDVKEYESGFVCDKDNEKVIDNVCVRYEIVDAKKW